MWPRNMLWLLSGRLDASHTMLCRFDCVCCLIENTALAAWRPSNLWFATVFMDTAIVNLRQCIVSCPSLSITARCELCPWCEVLHCLRSINLSSGELWRLGLLMSFTMTLHNLPEGFAVRIHSGFAGDSLWPAFSFRFSILTSRYHVLSISLV